MAFSLGDFGSQMNSGGLLPAAQVQQMTQSPLGMSQPLPAPPQQQSASAQQSSQSNPMAMLSSLQPDDLSGVGQHTTSEADKYQKLAQASLEKANKAKMIGGILNLVGGLATSANQLYQNSKKTPQIGLPIGQPLQIAGQGIQGLIQDPAQAAFQKNQAKYSVSQIPNISPELKGALLASVDTGNTSEAFKGLADSLAQQTRKGNPELAMVQGRWADGTKVTDEERAAWDQMLQQKNTKVIVNTNPSPEQKESAAYDKQRLMEIEKELGSTSSLVLAGNPNSSLGQQMAQHNQEMQAEAANLRAKLSLPQKNYGLKQAPNPPKNETQTTRLAIDEKGQKWTVGADGKVIGKAQ